MRILIIGSVSHADPDEVYAMQDIRDRLVAVSPADSEVCVCNYDFIRFEFDGEFLVYDGQNNRPLTDYELVIFKGLIVDSNWPSAIGRFLDSHGVPHVNDFTTFRSLNKLQQLIDMHELGMKIPPTTYVSNKGLLRRRLVDRYEFPVIIKAVNGSKGNLNFKVESREEAVAIFKDYPKRELMVQKFIPSGGDYRILVVGEQHLVMRRHGKEGSHLSNISKGGRREFVSDDAVPAMVIDQAKQLAAKLHFDIAGIDIIVDEQSGEYYFLEINSQPALTYSEADALLRTLLEQKLKGIAK